MGGFDCRFENINMCCNDLSFRIQHDGGNLHLPPKHIMWNGLSVVGGIILESFFEHDKSLFDSIYKNDNILDTRRYLDYYNWVYNTDPVWSRRFYQPTIRVQP